MSELAYLAHHGIKGQKRGNRRFQNYDGSLTPAGRERYGVGSARKVSKTDGPVKKASQTASPAKKVSQTVGKIKKSISDMKAAKLERKRNRNEQLRIKTDRIKESAYLEEEEKHLRKEMKRAKREGTKEARGDYSKKDIKALTDEEIKTRLNRLQQESKLIEAQLNQNPMYQAMRDALIKGSSQAVQTIAQNTLTDLGKKYLKVDMNTAANKTTKDIENELRDKFNLQKLKDEMTDYSQTREDNEIRRRLTRAQNERDLLRARTDVDTYDQTRQDDELRRRLTRAQNERDLLKARTDIDTHDQTRQDDELRRTLTRAQNERDLLKARNDIDTYDQTRRDDELRREVTRAQNFRDLVSAKKSATGMYKSAEDKSKDLARRITERKELERRAQAYYGNGKHSLEEVARAMNMPLSTIKDLLYVIDDYED